MPGGRPPYKPNDKERSMVSLMAAAGILHDRIASSMKIDDDTLRKHFREELTHGMDQVTTLAVGQLVQQIKGGNLGAICFWLKCRAGWRETSHVDNRLVDKDGNDRPLDFAAVRAFMQSVPDDPPK